MPEIIAFDTHNFVKRMTSRGFTTEQAEALAEEQVTLLNSNLVTSQQLAATEERINARIDATNARIDSTNERIETLRAETKQSIAATNERIASMDERIVAMDKRITETNERIVAIDKRITETNERIAATDLRIEAMRADLLKWMGAGLIATATLIILVISGVLFALLPPVS